MSNSASARKRVKQAEQCRQHNISLRSKLRTYIKNVVKAIATGDKAKANETYRQAVPVIDSGVSKGLIHKNKAARHKKRLNQSIRKMTDLESEA